MDGLPFEELVARVDRSAYGVLERLDEAVALREALAADADRVMDHFVGRAREAGESWTAIGERLGVSKQAARQRFNDRVQSSFALPFRPRLKACLDQAQREAQADGSPEVGTQHLLVGLLAEGVGAATMEKVGLTADAIRNSSHRLFGPPTPATAGPAAPATTDSAPARPAATDSVPAMSAEATCALEVATHNALSTAAQEVGTEHLLAALALDPGSRSRRILNDLDTDIAAIKRELSCYVPQDTRRRRRRGGGKFSKGHTCSFCGRPASEAGHLVEGPGVWICAACVSIAVDVLNSPQAG